MDGIFFLLSWRGRFFFRPGEYTLSTREQKKLYKLLNWVSSAGNIRHRKPQSISLHGETLFFFLVLFFSKQILCCRLILKIGYSFISNRICLICTVCTAYILIYSFSCYFSPWESCLNVFILFFLCVALESHSWTAWSKSDIIRKIYDIRFLFFGLECCFGGEKKWKTWWWEQNKEKGVCLHKMQLGFVFFFFKVFSWWVCFIYYLCICSWHWKKLIFLKNKWKLSRHRIEAMNLVLWNPKKIFIFLMSSFFNIKKIETGFGFYIKYILAIIIATFILSMVYHQHQ